MSVIQVLHYYCKPRRADILNNVTYQRGISCQVQDSYLDISDIVKELTNKNHIDCIAIDEDLFGTFDSPEDIKAKIEVLKYLCEGTEVLIIALDKTKDDEIIKKLISSDIVDFVITKEMVNEFEEVVAKYFDGELKNADIKPIVKEKVQLNVPEIIEDNMLDLSDESEEISEIAGDEEILSQTEENYTEELYAEEVTEQSEMLDDNDDSTDVSSSIKEECDNTVEETKKNLARGIPEFVLNLQSKKSDVSKKDDTKKSKLSLRNFDIDEEFKLPDIDDGKMITIGICGLQPHIGVTHHALAMAQGLSQAYKVCYMECNDHNAYRVLEQSSLKKDKPGYIRLMDVDVFEKNTDITLYADKYRFCIMDFGQIHECKEDKFVNTDIPIIIAGVKDWEMQDFVGAYASGILEKVNVLINFFPGNEQMNFKQAFPNLKIHFLNYAPEVFDPSSNTEVYNQIVKESMKAEV